MAPPVLQSHAQLQDQQSAAMASKPSNLMNLMQYMGTRSSSVGTRRQATEFIAIIITVLSQQSDVTSVPQVTPDTSDVVHTLSPLHPCPAHTQIKDIISQLPSLQPDATYQMFWEWHRQWQDYAVMTYLATLSLGKGLTSVHKCFIHSTITFRFSRITLHPKMC